MEQLAYPGAGAIIERVIDGQLCILVQERQKIDAPREDGLLEIPAGKIRAFESVYDCLRREIREETGLDVVEIQGEQAACYQSHGYRVQSFQPFACAQNLAGHYPIMVLVFLCRVAGEALPSSDESRNIRWLALAELRKRLEEEPTGFYPMHVETLRHYLRHRQGSPADECE